MESHAAADTIVASLGILIHYAGDQAFYRYSTDNVVMPERGRSRDISSGNTTQKPLRRPHARMCARQRAQEPPRP
jgi:antirestriction protein ArdC